MRWLLLGLALAGCAPEPGTPALSGRLSIEGSTTVAPILQLLLARIAPSFPDLAVALTVDGSGKGIAAAGEGRADLGLSSRPLSAADVTSYPRLTSAAIARDGLSVIVSSSNAVKSLTLAQVQAIFAGDITNWSKVGGADVAITVITRTADSGTATFFNDTVMQGRAYVGSHLEFAQSTELEAAVGARPGAIGYAGLAFTDGAVRALSLDAYGIVSFPTEATVRSGQYLLSRDLLVVSNGPTEGLAKAFFELLISQVGQQAVTDSHYVPVR
jgi:phosphate transport system substrate-binding protein